LDETILAIYYLGEIIASKHPRVYQVRERGTARRA
jgi:hypothetical protein